MVRGYNLEFRIDSSLKSTGMYVIAKFGSSLELYFVKQIFVFVINNIVRRKKYEYVLFSMSRSS